MQVSYKTNVGEVECRWNSIFSYEQVNNCFCVDMLITHINNKYLYIYKPLFSIHLQVVLQAG